jgi:hypothetical protein
VIASAVARKMALDNQAQQQKDGLQLAGRVWFAPDTYGEIYDDTAAEPQTLTSFVSPGSSPLAKEMTCHRGMKRAWTNTSHGPGRG